MDEVMDRVVETQLKIYDTICYRSFVFLVIGNLVYKCEFVCRDGSRVLVQVRGLKTMRSGKLSDSYTTAVYIYYKLEEGIVGVDDGTSNQAVNR